MAFEPENTLEEAMLAASRDPEATPSFLRALGDAEVYVPQEQEAPSGEEERTLSAGQEVALPVMEHQGRQVVPVFSSMAQLSRYVPEGTAYLRARGRDLASLWPKDAWMALNPRGDLGTMLSPHQVRGLGGTIRPAGAGQAGTVVGEPDEEPRALLQVIELYCRRTPEVRAAYRALLRPEEGGTEVVIGLELDDGADWDRIRRTASEAARESGVASFALVPVHPDRPGAVARYMIERTEPFYRREERAVR